MLYCSDVFFFLSIKTRLIIVGIVLHIKLNLEIFEVKSERNGCDDEKHQQPVISSPRIYVLYK